MTERSAATGAAAQEGGLCVLQRVVFPGDDLDVVPLYVETNMDRGAAELAAEQLTQSLTKAGAATSAAPVANALSARPSPASGSAPGCRRRRPSSPATPGRGAAPPSRPAAGSRSPPTSTPSRPATGAAGPTVDVGDAAAAAGRRGDDRPVPVDGQGAQPCRRDDRRRCRRAAVRRAHPAARAVHRRRLVLVRPRGRQEPGHAHRGGLGGRHAARDRAARPRRPGQHRHHHLQPAGLPGRPTCARWARRPRSSTAPTPSTSSTRAPSGSASTPTSPTRPSCCGGGCS